MAAAEQIANWARRRAVPFTLNHLVTFAKASNPAQRAASSTLLVKELKVRYAQQHRRLELLPLGIQETKQVRGLVQMHKESFEALQEDGISALQDISVRHSGAVQTLGEGVRARLAGQVGVTGGSELEGALTTFLRARVGCQLLLDQAIAVQRLEDGPGGSGSTGLVVENARLEKSVAAAQEMTMAMAERTFMDVPEIEVRVRGEGAPVTHIPRFAQHILFEVLKNAVRATCEAGDDSNSELPPVVVDVVLGKEDGIVRVRDRGPGLPRSAANRPLQLLYSTSDLGETQRDSGFQPVEAPFTGMGMGLPLSRLFARHFGGDLRFTTTEGLGTTCTLFVPRSSEIPEEALPPPP